MYCIVTSYIVFNNNNNNNMNLYHKLCVLMIRMKAYLVEHFLHRKSLIRMTSNLKWLTSVTKILLLTLYLFIYLFVYDKIFHSFSFYF